MDYVGRSIHNVRTFLSPPFLSGGADYKEKDKDKDRGREKGEERVGNCPSRYIFNCRVRVIVYYYVPPKYLY